MLLLHACAGTGGVKFTEAAYFVCQTDANHTNSFLGQLEGQEGRQLLVLRVPLCGAKQEGSEESDVTHQEGEAALRSTANIADGQTHEVSLEEFLAELAEVGTGLHAACKVAGSCSCLGSITPHSAG